ncbi:MAG: efflux RND transporter permease subunit [Chromatiales bacterium]|nr:MAG: efflux RND transporter permease subunit [Chromatiales bacterium]
MVLSETSVRRPVFAAVISLVLVIVGLLALNRLAVREFPAVDPPIVSIQTDYRGASAEVVERRITQLIENEIAGISGVQKLTSSSKDEISSIVVEFALSRDADDAANDVRERISRIQGMLPEEAEAPRITKQDTGMDATMYVDVSSEARSLMEITDFVERSLVDRLSVIDGVATIRVSGARIPAMRIWIDREALAARQLTVADVEDKLRAENVELPAGRIESTDREFTLRTETGLHAPEDFENLILKRSDAFLVRLGDVADVRLEPESTRRIARSDGRPGVSMGVIPQSQANVLAVNQAVLAELDRLKDTIPGDIKIDVNVDFSVFIRESMKEVLKALALALLMVLAVIYSFLGSFRATLIPAVTIPVAIISSFIVMAVMGFSVNTLTLLGLVLAIGLVVDDAIVVLENIVRRMEQEQPPLLAAIDGSREIGFAVVATTVVLIAVFVPISFMPGKLGRLFGEFGISLAAAVAFSSLIALTLVPMLASKLFANTPPRRRTLASALDKGFVRITSGYRRVLSPVVQRPWIALMVIVALGAASYGLFRTLPDEYAPVEDRGMMFVWMRGPEGASPDYMDRQVTELERLAIPYVDQGYARRVLVRSGMGGGGGDVNSSFSYIPLMPWNQRDRSAQELAAELNQKVAGIPGVIGMVMLPPSLNIRSSGQPLIVVLGGTDYGELAEFTDRVITRAAENPNIMGLRSDYFERKPKIQVQVDRNRAADLGVSLSTVGRTLETMLGSRVVTTFEDRGEEYNVLLQAKPEDRATPSDLQNIYVRSERGELIPLANLVRLKELAGPLELKRFDRLRSISMTGSLAPGYSLGQALNYMDRIIREEVPEGVRINYDGESREFRQSGSSIYFTFGLALLLSFLVLSAQFESFRHPLIIMLTVPMALFGGLLGLHAFDSSINVYSQIGAIMLIGLAAKNGILIVEFANQLRDRGVVFTEAILEAATVRLRPVIMTSLCTAGGAIPLMLAAGAGAESRRTIGAVVFFGVTVSVFLTLFLIPSVYALLARRTESPEHVSRMVERLRESGAS